MYYLHLLQQLFRVTNNAFLFFKYLLAFVSASNSFIHNVQTNQITKNMKFITSAISLAIYA